MDRAKKVVKEWNINRENFCIRGNLKMAKGMEKVH